MTSTNENGNVEDQRQSMTRRQGDIVLVRTLTRICIALGIVVAVAITYIIVTTTRVDHQAAVLTRFVCVQNALVQGGRDREQKLARSGPPQQRATHEKSAADFDFYLQQVLPLVDCSHVDLRAVTAP